jgi:hypothetical protein
VDPVAVVLGVLDTIENGIAGLAGPALAIGASVVALRVGWGVGKRLLGQGAGGGGGGYGFDGGGYGYDSGELDTYGWESSSEREERESKGG